MADPLAPFIHQLEWTALKFLIPAAVFAGVIQIFGKDMVFWAVKKIRGMMRPKSTTAEQQGFVLDAPPSAQIAASQWSNARQEEIEE